MVETNEEILLEIENTYIKCNKKHLCNNSDYFKVMFEGNFIERNQSIIKLHGVNLKSMNFILKMLWDHLYFIDGVEDILGVLEVAAMLQFDNIKWNCVRILTEMLDVTNCLKIWLVTEPLDIIPLYLKAKSMAMIEFKVVKEQEILSSLNLRQLRMYLGSVYLRCDNKMDVFVTGIKWFYENASTKEDVKEQTEVLLCVLSCLDVNRLSDGDVREIMTYPDVAHNETIMQVLNCVLELRTSVAITYESIIESKAKVLLNSRTRVEPKVICLLVNIVDILENQNKEILHGDKRKRFYVTFENEVVKICEGNEDVALWGKCLLYYDNNNLLQKLMNVSENKLKNLEGYSMIAYKEFIFLLGGETSLGSGSWNYSFWVYDTLKEKWKRRANMPCERRHFEYCIVNDYLYIVGGTGLFRVLKRNMFWYNCKEDKWSSKIALPCRGLQIRCCKFKNQLLVMEINDRVGYLYDQDTSQWVANKIKDPNGLVCNYPDKYNLFAYKDSIFIKGFSLIELKLVNNTLEVISSQYLKPIWCNKLESVICNNFVYTLYVQNDELVKAVVLEKFDLTTKEFTTFPEIKDQGTIKLDNEFFNVNTKIKMFELDYYRSYLKNDYVVDCNI